MTSVWLGAGTRTPTCRTAMTSAWLGAGTRTARHRDRMAGITWLLELATSTIRHVPMYFSIVRRSPCCASLVSRSASVTITTDGKRV